MNELHSEEPEGAKCVRLAFTLPGAQICGRIAGKAVLALEDKLFRVTVVIDWDIMYDGVSK